MEPSSDSSHAAGEATSTDERASASPIHSRPLAGSGLESARRLTRKVLRTLVEAPTMGLFASGRHTRMATLERAIKQLDSHPVDWLDLAQTEVVVQSTNGARVRHTLLSAAFHACASLEPLPATPIRGASSWEAPPTAPERLVNTWWTALRGLAGTPDEYQNDPRGRHQLQARLWTTIRRKEGKSQQEGGAKEEGLPSKASALCDSSLPAAVPVPGSSAKVILPPVPILHTALKHHIPGAPTVSELLVDYGANFE